MDVNRREEPTPPALQTHRAQVADRQGISMGVLISDHGLNDFLLDEVAAADSPAEIATKALLHFSVEEGRFNGFLAGVEMTLPFLRESLGGPRDHQQFAVAVRDLKKILDTQANAATLRRWTDARFA